MWFDVQAALAEIEGGGKPIAEAYPPATSATPATPAANPIRVAIVASVATPPAQRPEADMPETAPPVANLASVAAPETFPHGLSVAGKPLTWMGRVVSLNAWSRLTDWERHGPNGRLWNGITGQWEDGGRA